MLGRGGLGPHATVPLLAAETIHSFQLLIKLTILKYAETTETIVPGAAGGLPVVEVVQLQQVVELVRHGDGICGDGALYLCGLGSTHTPTDGLLRARALSMF